VLSRIARHAQNSETTLHEPGRLFLKLDGIQGESQDDKHKNEIQLASFNVGLTNAGTGGANLGSGAGRSNLQDMHFTKQTDSSSPSLFLACCTGRHIPTATITIRKAGENPVEYLVYKLTEVFVSSHNASGQQGAASPRRASPSISRRSK
jgi:type VI secretion system secreted protein Hcp